MDAGVSSATAAAVARLREELDGRRLIWFGIRGEDGEALLQIPELSSSYSIIAKLRSSSLRDESNVSLEEITGVREDLDTYDIDEPASRTADVLTFRRRLLSEVSGRCVVMPYRPSGLVSSLAFARRDTVTLAGLHKDRQHIFENKPWVETELGDRGVRGLGWRYVADEHRDVALRLLERGPQVIRASRTSGGVGIAVVRDAADLEQHWPAELDAFVGFAPYLDPTYPINLSGVVFPDGSVRLHPASLQLIGVPSCTDRPFGYVGNDFGALKSLSSGILSELDDLGITVGRWLHEERYNGVFGVDALVHNGAVHFTEINARFQGSSALSARVARHVDVPDLFLDHLAAMLGTGPLGPRVTIGEWAQSQPDLAKIVVHNISGARVARDHDRLLPSLSHGVRLDQLPASDLEIQPDGVVAALTFQRSITETGFEIDPEADALASAAVQAFTSVAVEGHA